MTITARTLPFAVLTCALLWGSAFPGIKAIYAEWERVGVEPTLANRMLLAGIRFMAGGMILLLLAKQPWKEWKQTDKASLFWFAATQTGIQYLLFYSALAISSAVMGGLLVATGSFWWLLLAPIILKTPWPSKSQWLLIALGACGVLFAVYRPGAGSGNPALGALLFCCSTLSGSIGVIILQRILPSMGARAATGFGLSIGGAMLACCGFAAWPELASLFPPKVIWLTVYLALVSATGFGLWNHLTQLFPVNLLAGYRFLIPVCAVSLSSLLVAGESPGIGIYIGGSVVIAAVVGLQRLQINQAKGPKPSKTN
ncbi:DMT family transporter [Verrucomicrobiaceae bacterium N1E253]|uniref:DMT family transporter n=1 Tax=Oceaniferula marina TaxID=2748318 RepID=A0A851GD99_9BACT|nr:DMT family transporter [Oceaniferula marina]NWK55386.1 DMT family transporter [Oceaniferula marina]